MPTVDEVLKWHKESRLSEITAATTIDAGFDVFAEVNGLDQDDETLRYVWVIACTYMASRAIRALKARRKPEAFAEALAREMIDRFMDHPSRHN
jgi:hypothetical protein